MNLKVSFISEKMSCFCDACRDDKIETCNSFLIPQTPYPETSSPYCTRIGMCLYSPWRLMESLGMLVYGIVTCPLPCLTFNLDSYHDGNDVIIECCYPGCTWIPTPLHYKYTTRQGGYITMNEGVGVSCNFTNARPTGSGNSFSMTSHTPGGRCLQGGFQKLCSTTCDVVCCPVAAGYWVCS